MGDGSHRPIETSRPATWSCPATAAATSGRGAYRVRRCGSPSRLRSGVACDRRSRTDVAGRACVLRRVRRHVHSRRSWDVHVGARRTRAIGLRPSDLRVPDDSSGCAARVVAMHGLPANAAAIAASAAVRDGDGRRGRPLRCRGPRSSPSTLDARGVRPRHRAHAQLRGRGDRHAQLDLQVPRGGLPEPDAVRGGVPRRDVDHPRAELPVEPAHPRRRQRGDRQQRGAPAEAPLDRAGRRRAHHPLPRRGRARRGRVRGARDRPARRHRAPALRRRRGLLPHQRAEPRRSRRRSCAPACRTASSAA